MYFAFRHTFFVNWNHTTGPCMADLMKIELSIIEMENLSSNNNSLSFYFKVNHGSHNTCISMCDMF